MADAYLASHPAASGYHASGWLGVFRRAFGHEPLCLLAHAGTEIVGALPLVAFRTALFGRFVVSLPFVNYGGIIADTPIAANALLKAAVAETHRISGKYLELRHDTRHFPELPCKSHKVAMRLPLERTVEQQWARIDRKIRNQVRKAEKSGFVAAAGGVELLADFYDVFAENMRDLGTPVYGRGFFREILATFPNATRVFCIRAGSRPVAASVVFWHGETIEVPWASTLRRFNPQCPNVLLYWEMVKFAVESEFRVFDLGRSTPDEGTFHYKKQWGAVPYPLVWEYWVADGSRPPDVSPRNPRYERAIGLWKRLPVAVTRLVGPPLVRGIP